MKFMRSLLAVAAASLLVSATGPDRTVLPIPEPAFAGTIAEGVMQSRPDFHGPVRAPEGAPNIFLFMSDDVGFAMSSTFGGSVPTPNMDKLAATGQRYNRFHTTAICSPTRASLLTGRNHHRTGVGYLSDLPAGYPGYTGAISRATATIAQILRLNGYNTAMFGKHHNVPNNFRSEAGPYDAWPTGLGFEYFFGFVNGDSDQYQANLYRGIQRVDPDEGAGKMLEQRFADDMIRYVHNQQAGNPGKPFLIYYAPGSTHAPHQAPPEYIARFKGQFDHGWDEERKRIFRRQLKMGIIPKGTKLTERPEEIPGWAEMSDKGKAYSARMMEVAAAQLVYQDEQLGRVLDELERMGQLDNTLVAIVNGDNGASAESGPKGTINELRTMGIHDESEDWLYDNIDRMGGPLTYQNYPAGWTWAMNTPLRWTKQYASMLGGIRNGAILSWPGHVAKPGSVCARFGHVNDVVPTVLDAIGIPAPVSVLGTAQKSMDGQSLLPSLAACNADAPRTQYFEIGGKIGLYHDGWFLSGDDHRVSWEDVPPGGREPEVEWTLYDLSRDFSQSTDVSARYPEKLAEMKALWDREARANDVYPIDHLFARARGQAMLVGGGLANLPKRYEFWGKDTSIPGNYPPILMARPFTVEAELKLAGTGASGVVLAMGSYFGGWSLYLVDGKPAFTWARSTDPAEIVTVVADQPLAAADTKLTMRFATTRPGAPAEVILSADGREYARANLPTNFLMVAGGGESLDVGRDLAVPVTTYKTPRGDIEGDIPHVVVTFD